MFGRFCDGQDARTHIHAYIYIYIYILEGERERERERDYVCRYYSILCYVIVWYGMVWYSILYAIILYCSFPATREFLHKGFPFATSSANLVIGNFFLRGIPLRKGFPFGRCSGGSATASTPEAGATAKPPC